MISKAWIWDLAALGWSGVFPIQILCCIPSWSLEICIVNKLPR